MCPVKSTTTIDSMISLQHHIVFSRRKCTMDPCSQGVAVGLVKTPIPKMPAMFFWSPCGGRGGDWYRQYTSHSYSSLIGISSRSQNIADRVLPLRTFTEAVRLPPERRAGLPREEPPLLPLLPSVPTQADQAA